MRTTLPLALATVLVITGIALAFRLTGSPQHQRELAFDQRRVEMLQDMTTAIANRYGEHHPLPARLPPEIAKSDPETGKPLEYIRSGSFTYRLCASFNAASEGYMHLRFSTHRKGRECFDRAVAGS